MKYIISTLKWVSVIVSLCIIAVLFLFEDDISAHFEKSKLSSISITTDEDTGSSYIVAPSEELEYDGTSSLDLMDGVSAVDIDGSDITDDITVQIIAGDSFNKKTVRYSVFNSDYQLITKDRVLNLYDYSGPSISIDIDIDINDYNLSNIVSSLIEDDILSADDGYGNDISEDICFSYTLINSSTSLYQVVFSVNNVYGDTDSVTFNTNIYSAADGPTVTLKQSSVTISQDSEFDPMDYVDTAVDSNGEDLTDYVEVRGNVNLSKTGQYTLTYQLTNAEGETSPTVNLIVYVR